MSIYIYRGSSSYKYIYLQRVVVAMSIYILKIIVVINIYIYKDSSNYKYTYLQKQ